MKTNVNKSVLEKKTDKELEEYLKPETRYVPEAIEYAYNILKDRGREFSDEEEVRLHDIFEKDKFKLEMPLHPNYDKAAYLMYISGAAGIITMTLTPNILQDHPAIFTGLAAVAFIFVLGFVISKGFNRMKYGLLILLLLSLMGMPLIVIALFRNPLLGLISLVQTGLQFAAMIYLFAIPTVNRSQASFRE